MFKVRLVTRPNRLSLWIAAGLMIATNAMQGDLSAQGPKPTSTDLCDQTKTLAQYESELKENPRRSLANFCIGEMFLQLSDYQAAADAFRAALGGDQLPNWTKAWSHLQLGKIFDRTPNRERAVLEYQRAIDTNDNTGGAVDQAREYLQQPYRSSKLE